MTSFPYVFLFSSTLLISAFIALSCSHWLVVWLALELNMISFIPLMTVSSQFQESEAAIKYFLFQALGSCLLLFGSYSQELFLVVILGMLIKLGMAPFHFWFPSVMNALSWPLCLLLTTWQKIIPLFILMTLTSSMNSPLILILASLSALTGGIGGLNQTQIRPLLAYSSIGHMGWMFAASYISSYLSMIYFLIYCFTCIALFLFLNSINSNSSKITASPLTSSSVYILTLSLLLLSLGGMPPLLGFYPKWLVISSFNSLLTPFLLILGSLLNLYYYLNISLSMFLSKPSSSTYNNSSLPALTMFILVTLTLPLLTLS